MADTIPTKDGYENYLKQSYGRFSLAKPHESVVESIMKKVTAKTELWGRHN